MFSFFFCFAIVSLHQTPLPYLLKPDHLNFGLKSDFFIKFSWTNKKPFRLSKEWDLFFGFSEGIFMNPVFFFFQKVGFSSKIQVVQFGQIGEGGLVEAHYSIFSNYYIWDTSVAILFWLCCSIFLDLILR